MQAHHLPDFVAGYPANVDSPVPARDRVRALANFMFDRGLELFDPPGGDVRREPHAEPPGDPQFAVARLQADAAQAVRLGLTHARAEEPPPLVRAARGAAEAARVAARLR